MLVSAWTRWQSESGPAENHLWTPPRTQAVFGGWHDVGCCHLSGHSCSRWLRARMGVRGPEPLHPSVLGGTWFSPGSSGPVSPTVVPYPPSTDLASRQPLVPTSALRRSRHRSSVTPALRQKGPDDAGHLVGHRNRHQHARLTRQHLFQPRTLRRSASACLMHD
jgi:hypothetical protein